MLRVSLRWRLAATAILFSIVLTSGWIFYRAQVARDQAVVESAAANRIPVVLRTVTQLTGIGEPITSAASFRDAAFLQGKLYVCAPGGVYTYDSTGTRIASYRTGRELPAGELTRIGKGRTSNGEELFVATAGAGVLAFNGTRFQQILPRDARLHSFTTVLGLSSGHVLLGTTGHGVLAWDGATLTDFLPALQSEHVTAIAGSDADLWFGTLAHGAYRYHAGQLDHVAAELPDRHVLSLAMLDGTAYVGTSIGVVEFRDGRKGRTLAAGYFAKSLDADANVLTVGTEDEGIVTVPLQRTQHADNTGALDSHAAVERILRVDTVRYALAGGLFQIADGATAWTRVIAPEHGALTDRNIAALSIGNDGRIWTGYFDRGLDVSDASFENTRHFEDERIFCVNRIVEEPGGARTAVATANGLAIFDAGLSVRQVLGRKQGLLADHVTDVLFLPGGMVIATPAGISMTGSGGVRSVYVFHGLVNNHVYSLASAANRIGAGTLGGLSLLTNDAVDASYTTANSGLKHNWISALARVGDEWFAGTYGAGVMRLDAAGQWHGFAEWKGGMEVNPNAMAQSGGWLYVGSLGKGLWVYSKAAARWTNVVAGLPSLNVTAVAVGNGFVYVGTDNGLVRYREGDLR